MGILGIENRSENWKTALYFSPMFRDESSRLNLATKLGAPPETQPKKVHFELHWKGMRDYLHENVGGEISQEEEFAERYRRLFPDLRSKIADSGQFRELQPGNYDVSTKKQRVNLRNNLINTEIDIVLETPTHLFIGEAKQEMGLGTKGSLVLVHQLIRQYVTAKILVDLIPSNKQVVLFMVGDSGKLTSLRNTAQVKFMLDQRWLKPEHVLSWDEIKGLHP